MSINPFKSYECDTWTHLCMTSFVMSLHDVSALYHCVMFMCDVPVWRRFLAWYICMICLHDVYTCCDYMMSLRCISGHNIPVWCPCMISLPNSIMWCVYISLYDVPTQYPCRDVPVRWPCMIYLHVVHAWCPCVMSILGVLLSVCYQSLTAHQHQKGYTVPKQLLMLATSIEVATV